MGIVYLYGYIHPDHHSIWISCVRVCVCADYFHLLPYASERCACAYTLSVRARHSFRFRVIDADPLLLICTNIIAYPHTLTHCALNIDARTHTHTACARRTLQQRTRGKLRVII